MSLPVTSSFCSVGIGTGALGIAGVTTSSCCCCAVQVLVVEHERHIDSPVSCLLASVGVLDCGSKKLVDVEKKKKNRDVQPKHGKV